MKKESTFPYKVPCKFCKKDIIIHLTNKQYESLGKYNRGEGHIQDLLPDLTSDEREMFISGMCPECWAKIFDGEEE